MLKWIVAVVLIIAMLSVAGCCCCSGYDQYSYATVDGQGQANAGSTCGQCGTPYDCLDGSCGSCIAQK